MGDLRYNEGVINSFTNGTINEIPVQSGHIHLDCQAELHKKELTENSFVKDITNSVDVKNGDIIYVQAHPRSLIEFKDVQKDKYYWNFSGQQLYKFKLSEDVNPWVDLGWEVIPVIGEPPIVLNTKLESFNKDAYYYNETITTRPELYHWSEALGWEMISVMEIIFQDPSTVGYDIDTVDYKILYFDAGHNKIYRVDPFIYLENIEFTSSWKNGDKYTIYERTFDFYRQIQDTFIDVNSDTRIDYKALTFVANINKIKEPIEGNVYYDSKSQEIYICSNGSLIKVEQGNKIIPQEIFY